MPKILLILFILTSAHKDFIKHIRIPLTQQQSDITEERSKISPLGQTSMPIFLSTEERISLKNYWNKQFIGTIGVGTPPQQLTVIFDTGSGNFFVNSESCLAFSCMSRQAFDSGRSSTYSSSLDPIVVQFGSGSVLGIIGNDTLTLGDLSLPDQNFAEILFESGSIFFNAKFSAIMGLGFSSLADKDTVPVFDHIVNSKLLDWNVFSFYYVLDEDKNSELMIGDVDKDKYTGKIHWVPLTEDPYYWTVLVTDVRFGENSTGLCQDGCKAALDTGTTLMLAPSDDLDVLYTKIENACDFENMPDLIFVIDGRDYAIPASSYMISVNEEGSYEDPGIHEDMSPEDCVLAMNDIDVGPPQGPVWVLGNLFMNSFYVAFDRDKMSVGLAKSINTKSN